MSKRSNKKDNSGPPLLSMTGFGKARVEKKGFWVEVEIKSVNHRFFDCSFKLPRTYAEFENELRAQVVEIVERGRVEVYASRGGTASVEEGAVVFNKQAFESLMRIYDQVLPKRGKLSADIQARVALDILSRREVLSIEEEVPHAEGEHKLVQEAFAQALAALTRMRLSEGEKLGVDIKQRIDHLSQIRLQVAELVRDAPATLRVKLLARVQKLAVEVGIDDSRLASEALYLADRVDITEELVRLGSHLTQFEQTLQVPPNGRKLEFVLQEIGREMNTIGSKVQDAAAQSLVVEAKSEIEKIREQIQNVV